MIELKSKRSLTAKHFDKENGEFAMEAHIGHIHYFDKLDSGRLRGVDWNLQWDDIKKGWYFKHHSYQPFIPEYSNGWIEFRDLFDGKDRILKTKAIGRKVKGRLVNKIDGLTDINAVIYDNVFGEGIDYIIYFTRSEMKRVVRIRDGFKPKENTNFDFEIEFPKDKDSKELKIFRAESKDNLAYELNLETTKEFDTSKQLLIGNDLQDGKECFTYLRPFKIWDSEQLEETIKVQYSVKDGKKYLRKIVSKEFLDKSVGNVFTDDSATYYSGAGDGFVFRYLHATWASARNTLNGDDNDYNLDFIIARGSNEGATGGTGFRVGRAFFPVNTSGLPDVSTIISAKIYICGKNKNVMDGGSLAFVITSQASVSSLVNDDFDTCGSLDGATEIANRISHTNYILDAYNEIDITDLDVISKTGYTKLGARLSLDIDDIQPTVGHNKFAFFSSEETGTDKDPKLVVTYTTENTHSIDLELSSSQYLSITDANQTGLDLNSDFTFEMWIKLEQLSSTTGIDFIVLSRDKWLGTIDRAYKIYIANNTDKIFLMYANDAEDWTWVGMDEAFVVGDVGTWIHIAFVADISEKTILCYKNGSIKSGTYISQNATSIHNSAVDFRIGADEGNSVNQFFDGKIDEVRIWNDMRTATEISDNYQQELVGTEANLVAYWRLNNNLLDQTANNNDLTNNNAAVFSSDVPFGGATSKTFTGDAYLKTTNFTGDANLKTTNFTGDAYLLPTLDFITTCNWTSTGTFTLRAYRGSSTNIVTSVSLFYRKKGDASWIETTNGEVIISSTGEWEIANNWNKSGNDCLTHSYYGITAINSCTEVYFNEATLGATVGNYFLNNSWYNCSSLTSMPSGFNLPTGIITVGNNFLQSTWGGCTSLTSMPTGFNLPTGITTVGSHFLFYCWDGCSSLTSMPSGFNLSTGITTTGDCFLYCSWRSCPSLTSMPSEFNLPSGITTVGSYFLYFSWGHCTSLTSMPSGFNLPSGITTVGVYFLYQCWYNCTLLTSDGYTENITFEFDASEVFAGTCPITPNSVTGASKITPVNVAVHRPVFIFSSDTNLKKEIVGSYTGDSVITTLYTTTFTGDARITTTHTAIFTGDASLKSTETIVFTSGSNLKKIRTDSYTGDSVITTLYTTAFTGDACIVSTTSVTFTGDANIGFIESAVFTGDANLKGTNTIAFTGDSFITKKIFLGDANLKAEISSAFTGDAYCVTVEVNSFTGDANLKRKKTTVLTSDANIKVILSAIFTGDACLKSTETITFTGDANLKREKTTVLTGDANIKIILSAIFTGDACLRSTEITVFTGDANLKDTETTGFTGDASLKINIPATFNGNANLKKEITCIFTGDASIVSLKEVIFTGDASLKSIETTTFTSDTNLKSIETAVFTGDATFPYTKAASFAGMVILNDDQQAYGYGLAENIEFPLDL